MSSRAIGALCRSFRLVAATLLFVAFFGLICISFEKIYGVVVKSLLSPNAMPATIRVGAVVAAAIPLGFLTVYSVIAVVVYGRRLWELASRRSPR